MKIILYLFILSLSLSCSVESSVRDDYEHQGKWELVRTKSNMTNAEYEQPDFTEVYTFNHNGTFIKTRSEGNSKETAEGTYKIVKRPWQGEGEPLLSLELKFPADSPLLANCTAEPEEHLVLTPEFVMINTWIMCDGFTMEYEKSEPTED